MNLSHFVFFDETSTDTTSNIYDTTIGGDQIALQVTGIDGAAVNVKVQGKIDLDDGTWVDLAPINASDFAVLNNITADGIYYVATVGINHMRMINDGTAGTVKAYTLLTR